MHSKLHRLLDSSFEALHPELQKDIYYEFYRMVYGMILYMVREHAATEDIIQESFLKLIRNRPQMDSEIKLKGWIKVVVRNSSYNYLRKNKKNRNEMELDGVFINNSLDYATETYTLETEVELKVMTEEIDKCLSELKPEYRALIELRFRRGFSYKEMADELELTEQTVKSKLHKARQLVKRRFLEDWG